MKKKLIPIILIILILAALWLLTSQDKSDDVIINLPATFTSTFTQILTPANTATQTPSPTLPLTPTLTFTPTPTFTLTPTPTLTWNELDDDGDGVLNYADNCPQKYAATSNGCPQNNDGGSGDAWDDDPGTTG